jgi:hypothetical protein
MRSTVPAGVFWADDLETLDADPVGRLALARKYMPLPAAFQEAATALRALILERSRQSRDSDDLLRDLYRTAAQESFLLTLSDVPGVGSSYSVASTIPRDVWEALPMPYPKIGYRHLSLLNWTDRDWLAVAWGEPTTHCSAREYHASVWQDYLRRYVRSRRSKRP